MRILMDGYWWHDGPQAARTVQRELVLAWARAFPEDEVVVALRRDAETDDLPAGAEVVRTRLWPHAASNRWELPLLAAGAGTELAVCHNYTPAAGPSLLFLHDVMFEEHPEWFSLAERLYFSAMLPWARRAALVATSTRTEADRIARHAPSLPQSIVTGLGVPPSLDAEPRRPSRVPAGSEFAVTVGRLNVRKNLETAMLAAVHSARISPEHPLYVVGGTAWDFANDTRVDPSSLDLLVIDEAGQFSLANTVAAGRAARRLLLIGDPQQLPQVSQGTHPAPVDGSALGWLCDGEAVIPERFGYFLGTSWRMHPELCAAVSDLAYDGRLGAHESARRLTGVEPGLEPVAVRHAGSTTSSTEEADAVVAIVRDLVGREWHDGTVSRPLKASDVIVVAPYNAQVGLLHDRLAAAGFGDASVGTVDRFQGREAAVVIVSMAASSAVDVPRGIEFLLSVNRLNVAISRGQWRAYLVHSPGLRAHLPPTPEGVAQLSAFLRLLG